MEELVKVMFAHVCQGQREKEPELGMEQAGGLPWWRKLIFPLWNVHIY